MTLWGLFYFLQNASFELLKFDPVIISLLNAADSWAHLTEQTKLETFENFDMKQIYFH
jgi:hypothetical protein